MAGADGEAGEEDRFVVVVVAGAVDRELPLAGGADVTQQAQFEGGGVGQRRVDIAEGPAVADLQAGDLGASVRGPWRAAAAPGTSWWSPGIWPRQSSSPSGLGQRVSCQALAQVRHKERMPLSSPYQIVFSGGDEQAVLPARARSARGPYRDRLRARIVLNPGTAGQDNVAIARQLGVCTVTVHKWRSRFAAAGLPGLADAARSGRPPSFTASGPGRGHRLGVRAARRVRRAAVEVEQPGPGPRTGRPPPASRSRRPPPAGGWQSAPARPPIRSTKQSFPIRRYGWFVHQRTFRSSRCVIPGLAAGVAGRAADQVGDRRRPVFGPRAGTPGPGRRRDG